MPNLAGREGEDGDEVAAAERAAGATRRLPGRGWGRDAGTGEAKQRSSRNPDNKISPILGWMSWQSREPGDDHRRATVDLAPLRTRWSQGLNPVAFYSGGRLLFGADNTSVYFLGGVSFCRCCIPPPAFPRTLLLSFLILF